MKDLIKKYWALILIVAVVCAALIYSCSFSSSLPNSSNSLLKKQDVKESFQTEMIINSSEEIDEKNQKTIEVAEEYHGKQIPVAIIKTDINNKVQSIEPVKRTYEVTTEVKQSKDQIQLTPNLTIKSNDPAIAPIKIKGTTTYINKAEPNGLVRDLNLGASLGIGLINGNNLTKLNSELPFVAGAGIGLDWLKWSQMRFLSPAIAINTDKQFIVQIEPIKYNLYSNSFIGIYIDTNYKGNISSGIKLSVNL